MRALLILLALMGFAGIVFGILTIIQGLQQEPFSSENYGGPGPVIGGLILMAVSLYLLAVWPRDDTRSRAAHHK